ncbi:hypothetical protein B0H14DRAFT_2649650 [Mycena olivaceomarginata]|nr:hypothetical protein B0H14DRAFT_2649650 [Mycena olivaceomarginata]
MTRPESNGFSLLHFRALSPYGEQVRAVRYEFGQQSEWGSSKRILREGRKRVGVGAGKAVQGCQNATNSNIEHRKQVRTIRYESVQRLSASASALVNREWGVVLVKADGPRKIDTRARCEVEGDKLFAAQSGRRKKMSEDTEKTRPGVEPRSILHTVTAITIHREQFCPWPTEAADRGSDDGKAVYPKPRVLRHGEIISTVKIEKGISKSGTHSVMAGRGV